MGSSRGAGSGFALRAGSLTGPRVAGKLRSYSSCILGEFTLVEIDRYITDIRQFIVAKYGIGLALLTVTLGTPAAAQICTVPGTHADVTLAVEDVTCEEVQIDTGTWTTGNLIVERDLTIAGAGQNATTLVSNGPAAVITAWGNATVSVRDMTIEGADSTEINWDGIGVQVAADATMAVNRVTIRYFEGGVVARSGSVFVELSRCSIRNNRQGIYTAFQNAAPLLMSNCNVSENRPFGGMDIRQGNINDSTIADNVNDWSGGGGIAVNEGATLTDVTVRNNRATFDYNSALAMQAGGGHGFGGGIYLRGLMTGVPGAPANGHEVTIRDSTIEENYAGREGGGIRAVSCNIQQTCLTQPLNLVRLTLSDTTIINNRSSQSGGGMFAEGPVTLENVAVESNVAEYDPITGYPAGSSFTGTAFGGGMLIGHHGGTIENSVFRDNFSFASGGGIHYNSAFESELRIRNSTIVENRTNSNGGGIAMTSSIFESHFLTLMNSTVAFNLADVDQDDIGNGGGVSGNGLSRLTVLSSIIGGNRDNSPTMRRGNCWNFAVASIGGVTHHMVETFGGNVLGGAFAQHCPPIQASQPASPTDVIGQNPQLEKVVRENKTSVVTLGATSPALDAGYCNTVPALQLLDSLEVDQRGQKRDPDLCDSGAYEQP